MSSQSSKESPLNHNSMCITCRVLGPASDHTLLHCCPFWVICEHFSSQHDIDFTLYISLHNTFITILLTSSNNPQHTSPLPPCNRRNIESHKSLFSKGESTLLAEHILLDS